MTRAARYGAALSQHPIPVESLGAVAAEVLDQLAGERPDLVVFFASPHHTGAFEDLAGGLAALLEPDVLLGMSAVAVAAGGREVEDGPALSVLAADWGGGKARAIRLDTTHDETGDLRVDGWPDDLGRDAAGTLLLLADPFTFPAPEFLRAASDSLPAVTIVGGMASAARGPGGNRLALGRDVTPSGAVAVLIDDDVAVRAVVSQGCRPVGRPLTVTKATRNLIVELAGRPAIERVRELAATVPEPERDLLRHGLHVGIVLDEHRIDFGRGDFLVRNVLGAERETGAVAVGETVEVGQTVQFHVRDSASADADLALALRDAAPASGAAPAAALLFTCNGRGRNLFGTPDHDAAMIEERIGPLPLAGAFCAGEIGPVGRRAFLHGFTASIAVFG